jgi:transposase
LRGVIYHAIVAKIPYQDLETLVRQQAETIAQQAQIIEQQAATITRLEAENRDLRDQLEVMHFRVSQMSRRIFGNVSERIVDDADQAYLPGFGPALTANEAVSENDTDDDPDGDGGGGGRKSHQKKKRGGRLKLPDHLPRVDRVIEPDAEAHARHPHADRLVKIREEVTEKLDYVAGGFQVVRLIRPVYGIPHSDDITVSAAPPAQVVQRGLPTDRVVAMVLSEKFDLHNPLYRQQSRFQRAGIALPRATLGNWIGAATDHLAPIVQALRDEIHASPVIGLDDTTIQRLAPGTGRTHTGRFWGYASPHSCVVTYADSRAGAFPAEFLNNYSGAIVADAYSGHEPLYVDGMKRHIPCMAHIRRKFVDAYRDAGDKRQTCHHYDSSPVRPGKTTYRSSA